MTSFDGGKRAGNPAGEIERDVGVVIAAGGGGTRAETIGPKQFRSIGGVPMLLRALKPFAAHPAVGEIVVVMPVEYVERPPEWLATLTGDRLRLAGGGPTRAESVRNGLEVLTTGSRFVLVHDAARPFVSREIIEAVLARVRLGTSAIAAIPVTDTIKRADAGNMIRETIDRRHMWRAQTPQAFERSVLLRAFGHAPRHSDDDLVTDEATLVTAAGFPVVLVEDSHANFKITTPEDFDLAEAVVADERVEIWKR